MKNRTLSKSAITRAIAAVGVAIGLVTAYPQVAWAATTPTNYTREANLAATYISNNVSQLTGQPAGSLGQELDGYIALNSVKFNGGDPNATTNALAAMESDFVTTTTRADAYCKPGTTSPNVGGCAKLAIALMSAGQVPSPNPSSNPHPSALDTYLTAIISTHTFNQYATNQALAIIALARANKPVPTELYNVALTWSTSDVGYFPDTDTSGLMLTALSYVNDTSSAKTAAINNLQARLAAQKPTGVPGWGLSYDGTRPTTANINSTAWAAPGAYRTGDATLQATAVDAQNVFINNQQTDGSITINQPGWNAMMSTTQSVPPLLSLRSYDNAGTPATAAVTVGTTTYTGVTMSAKGGDTTVGAATTPIVVLGNVPAGTVSAPVLGRADLITGLNGFTYCLPDMTGPFNPMPGTTVTGTATNNVVSYSNSATLSQTGCYKWQVTLTVSGTTYTQTTEPFAVR